MGLVTERRSDISVTWKGGKPRAWEVEDNTERRYW